MRSRGILSAGRSRSAKEAGLVRERQEYLPAGTGGNDKQERCSGAYRISSTMM